MVASGQNDFHEIEYRWKVKSGEYRWFNDNKKLVRNFEGKPIALLSICRDITESRQMEQKLRQNDSQRKNIELALTESEEKYRKIVETANEGIVIIDTKLRLSFTNEMFAKLLGYDVSEIQGTDALTYVAEEFIESISVQLKKQEMGVFEKFEAQFKRKDGSMLWLSINSAPLADNEGNFIGSISMLSDITSQKEYEQSTKLNMQLEKALKLQEEIFANVSHELKTPLNVIFATNQMLDLYMNSELNADIREKINKGIKVIRQNCYRFTKLIDNIVDVSNIDSGFYKLFLSNEDIVELTRDIIQSVIEYAQEKRLNIIFNTDVEEKIIACDPLKIERILLNIISNAIKFSDNGSVIYVNITDKTDFIELSVKDNGIGIDKEHINSIFKRYYQIDKSLSRNTEGTGAGLFLVRSLVELHGGTIDVNSEVGKGSIFTINLPVKTVRQTDSVKMIRKNDKIDMINVEFSDIYNL